MVTSKAIKWNWIVAGLLLCLLVVIASTFVNYGPSWDETLSRTNGFNTFLWYDTQGKDASALQTLDLHLYGALFDVLAYVTTVLSPLDAFDTNHLLIALVSTLGLWGSYLLASHLAGGLAGLLTVVFLVFTPTYYGHSFINPKDIPFAVFFVWALYFLVLYLRALPSPNLFHLLAFGLFSGAALGVRIGGLLLFVYLAIFGLIWWLFQRQTNLSKHSFWRYLLQSIVALVIAWGVMLIFWPFAQVDPLVNPFKALLGNTHFEYNPLVLFDGRYYPAKSLPTSYLPTWFSIRLPEFYFAALMLSGLVFLKGDRTEKKDWLSYGLLGFAVIFPLVVAVALKSTLYDGIRHFIFVLPPLAILCGIGVSKFLEMSFNGLRLGVIVLFVGLIGMTGYDMVKLHPYEYIYFNRLVAGGVAKAGYKFDLDYWATSAKEGIQWALNNYREPEVNPIEVTTCADAHQISHWIQKDKTNGSNFVNSSRNPRLYLTIQRENCHNRIKGETLYTVERFGVPLLHVKRLEIPNLAG